MTEDNNCPSERSTSSPDWNCQWGPSGDRGTYSLYPRHVRASMLPKKETKYSYNAFKQITEIYVEITMSHWKRIMNDDTHLSLMWKEKSLYRCIKLTRRWNMIRPVIFARALTIFAGVLPPWAPPWWRGRERYALWSFLILALSSENLKHMNPGLKANLMSKVETRMCTDVAW